MAKRERKLANVAADSLVTRGLINGRDVRYEDPRWVYFDYGGKVKNLEAKPVAFEMTAIVLEDESITETQHWTIGDDRYYEPTDDGMALYVAGDGDGSASKSSNWGHFIQSLDEKGLPKDIQEKVAGDASVFAGLKMHCVRKSVDRSRTGEEKKASEVVVCGEFFGFVGEKGGKGKSSSSSSSSSTKKKKKTEDDSDSSDLDLDALAAKYIKAAVAAADEDPDFDDLAAEAMSAMIAAQVPKSENRQIRDHIASMDEEAVSAIDGIQVVKGKVVEL